MLVSPLFTLAFFFALVAAHDGQNLSHSRRAQAARLRLRNASDPFSLPIDVPTDPLGGGSPFATASTTDSAASAGASDSSSVDSASVAASTDPAPSTDPGSSTDTATDSTPTSDSQSISLPGATSTNIDASTSDAPVSTSDAQVSTSDTPVSTSDAPASTSDAPVSTSDAPVSTSDAPVSTSDAPASTTDIFSVLSSILSSVLDPPTSAPTSDSASITDSASLTDTTVFSASNVITDPPVSSPTSTSTSDTLSLPFSVSNPLSDPFSSLPVSDPFSSQPASSQPPFSDPFSSAPFSDPFSVPPSSAPISSAPISSAPSEPSGPVSSGPIDSQPVSSAPVSSGPIDSQPVSSAPISSAPSEPSGPSSQPIDSQPVSSLPVSSSQPAFPSGPSGSVSASGVSVTDSASVPTSTTTNIVQSVASDLTFILTESSLALAAVSTTSLSLSNPDAPTTTISFTAAAESALTTAALPSGLPSRIYPLNGQMESPGANYSFISLLFDPYLGWEFVVTNAVSSSQLFAYVPLLLAAGTDISTDDIKTFALQVRIPDSYQGPAQASELQTLFLAWIPTTAVDPLNLALHSHNSGFYTGVPDPVAQALAQHVVSAFALDSIADPGPAGDKSGGGSANDEAQGAASTSKTRQDAIIGVVTALGVIAVVVLIFLAFRAFRRRAELAHHRLSDPPDMYAVGARPEGREFDQDSVGGQRRRSFYFAEDSLRGFQGDRQEEAAWDARGSPQGMMQRRNVMPAAISAPILQQSSMNW